MKKISKIVCVILSFIMIFDLTSIQANATESVSEGSVIEANEITTDGDSETSTIEEESDESEVADNPVIPEEYIADLNAVHKEGNIINVSWTIKKDNIAGYKIAVYSDQAMTQVVREMELTDAMMSSVDISDLSVGVAYYVKVIPYSMNEEQLVEGKVESLPVIMLGVPSTVTAKAGDATATLKYGAVAGATSYEVVDGNTQKVLAITSATSCTVSKLKNNTTYNFQVRAVAELGDVRYVSACSEKVYVKPMIVTPGQVTGLKAALENKAVDLSWKAVPGATSYKIYRWDGKYKKTKYIKTVKGTSYMNTSRVPGRKYKYRVAAVRTSGGVTKTGKVSSYITVTAKTFATGKVRPLYHRGRVRRTSSVYKTSTSKTKVRTIRGGTSVTILMKSKGRAQIKLSSGSVYWIPLSRVSWTGSLYTTKDYSNSTKHNYVNEKGFTSKTNYLIWISQYTQRVNIYKGSKGKWKLIRSCRVATGTHLTRTPRGYNYKITYKEKGWFYRTTCVKKCVHFAGRNSFHSRIYRYNGSLADPTIGRPASHGCIRMYMDDINYIYYKMPIGTRVVSY